jgi:hypothetical protein
MNFNMSVLQNAAEVERYLRFGQNRTRPGELEIEILGSPLFTKND